MTETHEFEMALDIELAATPEQVWAAIATGPGKDSWLMGRNELEPRVGGAASITMPGFTATSTVTAYEPHRHLAIRGDAAEDGTFMAFEYLVEGREGGSTALRLVHSGILGGDWEAEYDALRKGNPLYLRTLAQYLEHFAGRAAVPVSAVGPPQADQDQVWAGITRAVGLPKDVREGEPVEFTVAGQTVRGVVDTVLEPSFLGLRTEDALLRFVGRNGFIMTGHHLFADADADADPAVVEATWTAWLEAAYA